MSNKNYAMGHALSNKQLFQNFPTRKMNMTNEQCLELYSDGNKKDLAAQIFARGLEMVIDDIIDNNVHFKLPGVGSNQAYIYMERTSGKKFKDAFRRGKWNDVDFLTSNFSGYQLVFDIESIHKIQKKKTIYLSAEDRDRITELTNQGKQY